MKKCPWCKSYKKADSFTDEGEYGFLFWYNDFTGTTHLIRRIPCGVASGQIDALIYAGPTRSGRRYACFLS